MGSFTPPTIGQANSTEDQKVRDALVVLDNLLDSSDLVPNAGLAGSIAHSKLANATAGQLLIANGSGVITATTLTNGTLSGAGALTGLTASALASDAVTTAKILDANVTDAKLASPNNSVYRTLLTAHTVIGTDTASGTYLVTPGENVLGTDDVATATIGGVAGIYFDDADYTVSSKTQKLRVRAQVWTNGTAPAITFTIGLYPMTVVGAADAINAVPGTVVSGSTVAIASPSVNSITQGNSGDFTVPSDGQHMFCCVTSGTIANNAAAVVTAQLQARAV